jgi:hypothetical protein
MTKENILLSPYYVQTKKNKSFIKKNIKSLQETINILKIGLKAIRNI